MRVGLEVSAAVSGRRSGVGNYVANMVDGLQKLNELELLYFSNRYQLSPDQELANLPTEALYRHDRWPVRSLWMQFGLPRSLTRTQPDLCHFPNYLSPVLFKPEGPFVATMYDMSVYRYPQYQPLKTVTVHRAIIPAVANSAKMITTISESARQDILHYLKVPADKVRVISPGVGENFRAALSLPETVLGEIRQRYNLDFPYILTVGTMEPRKNQARLIEAFTRLVHQENIPHHLVLAGGHGWKEGPIADQLARSGLSDRIHFLGYVPLADLPGLYRNASVFAFPSIYEGFGLPVLEALACGTPCLISNDPALVEVAGEGEAVAVNPYSVEDMAAGLFQLLDDSFLVESLRQRGIDRAAQFSWDRCAQETYQLYEEVMTNNPSKNRFCVTSAADSAGPEEVSKADKVVWHSQPRKSPKSSTSLEQAILETVLYADIFNFPLTPEEIQHYLIKQPASLGEVNQYLTKSTYLQDWLAQNGTYYCLKGREELLELRQKQAATLNKHWKAARRWSKLLRLVPYVRAALVTGSLAADSARPRDDIDLLILTEPGHLWTCRALTIGLVYLARLQGIELCPNYLIALKDAALTLDERNLYSARELAGMRLMFGRTAYLKMVSLNSWLNEILPNAASFASQQRPILEPENPGRLGSLFKKLGEKLLSGKMGQKFEKWEQRKIERYSRENGAEASFRPDLCKGHFGNYGHETLAAFAQRCDMIDPNGSLTAVLQKLPEGV